MTRLIVAAVVGLNVLVFGALALAGVPLFHLSGKGGSSAADDLRYVPLADAQAIPADQVVRAVLAAKLPGAKASGAVWASSGTPFDKACPDRSDPTPVISFARPYTVGGRTVSVRVSAYGAGQGRAALAALVDRLGSCSGAGTYGTAVGPTTTAVAAWSQSTSSDASTLIWNRSDVVASVTVPRSGYANLASVAKSVDSVLSQQLVGRCASESEKVADAGRSPWSVRPYTGNLQPQPVILTYPTPSLSPTPVLPSGVPTVPVPGPSLYVPQLATLPTDAAATDLPPTPPVVTPTPSGQPVQVAQAPVPPVAPSAPAAQVNVNQHVADPTGPGCGWAFTMQGVPNFDSAAAAAQFTQATEQAQAQLHADDAAWQSARAAYAINYANYVAQVDAFAAYARKQNVYVARHASAIYQALLEQYNAAVAARQGFDEQKAEAQAAYDAALEACAAAGSPTATPEPTDTAGNGFPTDGATPTDSSTPVETAPVCPPDIPPILNEPEPQVPPSPTPPR